MDTYFRDATLLVSRILVGVILIAHGYQKFVDWTIPGVEESFQSMGVPLPGLSAVIAATVELVGGILLLLGLFTRVTGVLVFLTMLFAAFFAHISNGLFIDNGGWELTGAIGATALALAGAGAGGWSLDALIARSRVKHAE